MHLGLVDTAERTVKMNGETIWNNLFCNRRFKNNKIAEVDMSGFVANSLQLPSMNEMPM